ncbi:MULTISPECIES: CU044_2847 family protein [Nonomuraea]|uniref:CU044_2847 family protein n=1 Tax=Nonomuraea mangrovi TaxID=2316207 RepID=A0ABW4SYK8_9ACTN
MRMPLEGGGALYVEVPDRSQGTRRVSRTGEVIEASVESLEAALRPIRDAAAATLAAFRESSPDEVELEFSVKLNAEAGAMIAKTCVEGHIQVRLSWKGEGG